MSPPHPRTATRGAPGALGGARAAPGAGVPWRAPRPVTCGKPPARGWSGGCSAPRASPGAQAACGPAREDGALPPPSAAGEAAARQRCLLRFPRGSLPPPPAPAYTEAEALASGLVLMPSSEVRNTGLGGGGGGLKEVDACASV